MIVKILSFPVFSSFQNTSKILLPSCFLFFCWQLLGHCWHWCYKCLVYYRCSHVGPLLINAKYYKYWFTTLTKTFQLLTIHKRSSESKHFKTVYWCQKLILLKKAYYFYCHYLPFLSARRKSFLKDSWYEILLFFINSIFIWQFLVLFINSLIIMIVSEVWCPFSPSFLKKLISSRTFANVNTFLFWNFE